ncbi:uncharacterized protein LOC131031150 [Cryptomeria japonica]|uniref:uncharacterized protein LOC131031150 n=1 Tax=Cryptomeria japonica TaxID=3369 RepID=UPI0027D9E7C6|nr:uncharacterized protein LOC131031150 [Cryptomeria japonica]
MEETRPSKRSKTSPTPAKEEEKKNGNDNEERENDDKSKHPLLVFAHGAGASSSSQWMIRWKKMLASAIGAVEAVTFDYPYFSGGKRGAPPKAENLVDPHVEEVRKAVAKHPGHPLILVGKSMGSRVSCMVAEKEDIDVSAVVCLGYPLKGVKGAIRDETLLKLSVHVMFVQGSKDALCPLQKLEAVRQKMTAMNELYVIDGGNHSLEVGNKLLKEKGINQVEVEMHTLKSIQAFVSKVLTGA